MPHSGPRSSSDERVDVEVEHAVDVRQQLGEEDPEPHRDGELARPPAAARRARGAISWARRTRRRARRPSLRAARATAAGTRARGGSGRGRPAARRLVSTECSIAALWASYAPSAAHATCSVRSPPREEVEVVLEPQQLAHGGVVDHRLAVRAARTRPRSSSGAKSRREPSRSRRQQLGRLVRHDEQARAPPAARAARPTTPPRRTGTRRTSGCSPRGRSRPLELRVDPVERTTRAGGARRGTAGSTR